MSYIPSLPHPMHRFTTLLVAFLWLTSGAVASTVTSSPSYFIAEVYADTTFTPVDIGVVNLGHGTVAWGDYDNDGDLDVLITGIGGRDSSNWDDPSPHMSRIYSNDGGTFNDIDAGLTGVNNNEGTIWSDYDNDGDLDLFIGGGTHEPNADPVSEIYRNDDGAFVKLNDHLPDLVGGAAWGDYDNDGDLDLFICGSPDNGSTFYSRIYRNNHGRSFTNIGAPIAPLWGGSGAWGDYDNDNDLDLLVVGWGGGTIAKLYRNEGGSFVDTYASLAPVATGQAKWGDFDGDGDLDIIMTGSNLTLLYRNDGDLDFALLPTDFPGLLYSTQAWGDYDNDGDLDLVVCGQDQWGDQIAQVHRNDDGVFQDIQANLTGLWYSAVNWGDYDNDGDLDLLMAGFQKDAGVWPYKPLTVLYQNRLNGPNQQPPAPAAAGHVVGGSTVTLSWESTTDDKTPQEMLTYNVRIGASPLGEEIVAAESDVQSGYRKVTRGGNVGEDTSWTTALTLPGTYYWSVQAVDNVYGGSTFSAEDSFTVIGPTLHYDLQQGWNLVSLPMNVLRPDMAGLFPMASPSAFLYTTEYVAVSTVSPEIGFWIKVPDASERVVMGQEIQVDTVSVTAGWNLIGSVASAISVSSVMSIPGGLVTSSFFAFSHSSYVIADSIVPGNGYWVKVAQPGMLVLSSNAASHPASQVVVRPTAELPPPPPGTDWGTPPGAPVEFSLDQNYPNPFNPSTSIEYTLAEQSLVRLSVYSLLGQCVGSIVDKVQDAGRYGVTWVGDVASGVYVCRLEATPVNSPQNAYVSLRKMILLR